jgi:hypothetical protein
MGSHERSQEVKTILALMEIAEQLPRSPELWPYITDRLRTLARTLRHQHRRPRTPTASHALKPTSLGWGRSRRPKTTT